MIYERIDAQCYVRKPSQPLFPPDAQPALRYICKISPSSSKKQTRVMHAHKDVAELVLIYSGESEYLIHNKKVPVQTGDLLVYNSGVVHDEAAAPDSEIGYYCAAIGELALPGLPENALTAPGEGYVFRTGRHFEQIRTLMDLMFENLTKNEADAERICDSLMHALIDKVRAVIREAGGDTPHPAQGKEDPYAMSALVKEYIDAHYTEQISLETIGKDLHMSPWYVSHLFKEMTGYAPIKYLLRRRIGEAQTLLISTDLPISEIALRVGYDSQSHFNSQFTKEVGMPPNQFRKNYVIP